MKTIVMLMAVSMLMIVTAPAYSGEAMQIWRCEMGDNASEEEVTAMAQEWLKAAKTMKGGERLKVFVNFPVVFNPAGQIDILFVVVAPSFEEWGKFWDSYAGSPVAGVDNRNREKIVCPGSALWEVVRVK